MNHILHQRFHALPITALIWILHAGITHAQISTVHVDAERQTVPPPEPAPRADVRSDPLTSRARSFVAASVAYQVTKLNFNNAESFSVLFEQATRKTAYQITGGPGFEASFGAGVARRVLIGAAASWRARVDQARIEEQIPHPILYNHPRGLTAAADSQRREVAVHAHVAYVLGSPAGMQLIVGGGPSMFHVSQAVVSDVAYKETYPYEAVTLERTSSTTASKFGIGANAGVDFIKPLSLRLGWQVSGRYSYGSLQFQGTNGAFRVPAGGAQIGAGLRCSF